METLAAASPPPPAAASNTTTYLVSHTVTTTATHARTPPTTHQGSAAATSFITLGDWGGAALVHPQYGINVGNVAKQMAVTSSKLDSQVRHGARARRGQSPPKSRQF